MNNRNLEELTGEMKPGKCPSEEGGTFLPSRQGWRADRNWEEWRSSFSGEKPVFLSNEFTYYSVGVREWEAI